MRAKAPGSGLVQPAEHHAVGKECSLLADQAIEDHARARELNHDTIGVRRAQTTGRSTDALPITFCSPHIIEAFNEQLA